MITVAILGADAQRLPEGIVGEEREVSRLFIPGHLHAVVIGIHLMVNEF